MSDQNPVCSDSCQIWSDIVRCPTVICSPAWLAMFEPFLKFLTFRVCSFFRVSNDLPVLPTYDHGSPNKVYCRQHWFVVQVELGIWEKEKFVVEFKVV